jgi:hypothetical protein
MSAFLGPIHYWLYNKIILHEELIGSIVDLAGTRDFDTKKLVEDSYSKFGEPVTGALEDHIEHSNIHGWLQDRIFSVEKRLAYVTTELLKADTVKVEEVEDIFRKSGAEAARSLEITESKPQDLFKLIFDNMLEGMPCDRVNEITENTEEAITWQTTRCLHKDHWDQVGGDINNFYKFRENWIAGFLNESETGYSYSRTADDMNTIRRM